MTSPIDVILAKAKTHCNDMIKPNVDAWNKTEISRVGSGRSLQKCAEKLHAARITKELSE